MTLKECYESFGGNDNQDLGDAYKGATTDAITKQIINAGCCLLLA